MAEIYDGKLLTVTLSAMRVQAALFMGLPVRYPLKSTLNEHFNVLADRLPEPDARPTLKYMVIGNRGHATAIEDDGLGTFTPVRHKANNSGMFRGIPFVLRPLENDLGEDARSRYAFRRKEEHGGRWYWAYYLKRLDTRGIETQDRVITRDGDVESVRDHAYTDKELYPQAPVLPDYDYEVEDKTSPANGKYVISDATLVVRFDDFDAQEYLNVTRIMRGRADHAIISEIALCTGVDATASGESATGSPFMYDEAIGVQVAYYMTCFNNIAIVNDRLSYTFKIGQDVPFFLGANV